MVRNCTPLKTGTTCFVASKLGQNKNSIFQTASKEVWNKFVGHIRCLAFNDVNNIDILPNNFVNEFNLDLVDCIDVGQSGLVFDF
jgi:hypothetical protein